MNEENSNQSSHTTPASAPRLPSPMDFTFDERNMEKCPHCNQPGLKASRKFTLGPAKPATCESCGKKIGVTPNAMLYYLPFFIAVFATWPMDSMKIKLIVWPLAFLGIYIVQMKLPLVKR